MPHYAALLVAGKVTAKVHHYTVIDLATKYRPPIDALSPMQCAGINRHEAGNERVLRERSSEPLGPEFCVAHREVFGEA
jgi:hypothetical protein